MDLKFKLDKNKQLVVYILVFIIAAFFMLPFVLFGTNSIISIHDNLDSNIPWFKMFHDNGLFLKFDAPTKGFCEMSTLNYTVGFSFQSILYLIFSDFIAYTLNYYFSACFGFISMYILLKKILNLSSILNIMIAVCFAFLSVFPGLGVPVGTFPFLIVVFCHFVFRDNNSFSWKVLLLLFYPFFSSFTLLGIFILGFWLLGIIVLGIRNRKININLVIGFLLLCIGYILVDLRLFYVMFVLKTPLNRNIMNVYPTDIVTQINVFIQALKGYGIKGYYHAASFQDKIIVPLAILVSLFSLVILFCKIKNQSGTLLKKIRVAFGETVIVKRLFLLEFTVFIFSCIAALYESGLLNNFILKFIPLLTGFNWSRVFIFNRVLWYLIFALCLQFILEIKTIFLKINAASFTFKVELPHLLFQLVVGVVICLQLFYIMIFPVNYNDQISTWFNEIAVKTGIAKKLMPNRNYDKFISYREFFAKDLFAKIKNDISYSDERVVALGYHPSVLMYNGFNCIDGYNNAYPLSYMQLFSDLLAPEFEINQAARDYYNRWGGRLYLFNSELSYLPTKDKNTLPVKLNIDMNVFRNGFNGVYILSRAEISNSDALGLYLVKRYYDEESIYTIYLYKINLLS
jgi:hypothetical protein